MKLFLAFLVVSSALALAPFNKCEYDKADDNRYLVLFHKEIAPDCSSVETLQAWLDVRARGAKVARAWDFMSGMAVDLNDELQLDSLRSIPEVQVVEENCLARIPRGEYAEMLTNDSVIPKLGAPNSQCYGLWRVDQCTPAYSTSLTFAPGQTGTGVVVWVLDTGVLSTHQEFQRPSGGGNAVTLYWTGYPREGTPAGTDGNGHGTHCAGTVGGNTVGVATNVKIYSNQVLNRLGSGAYDIVIEGVNQAVTGSSATSGYDIISMSLGGPVSAALDAAVDAASLGTKAGSQKIPVIVAAGNDGAAAVNYSPARAAEAIVIGATTSSNGFATYSNRGAKVNGLAPGSSIYSAGYSCTTCYSTMSGTSMACPLAAGTVALLASKSTASASPANVRSNLSSFGTRNAITGVPTATPNILFYDRWQTTSGCAQG